MSRCLMGKNDKRFKANIAGITRKQLTDTIYNGFVDISDVLKSNDYTCIRNGLYSICLIDRRNGNQFEISIKKL